LAIALAVVVVGFQRGRHLQGTNDLRTLVAAIQLAPGQSACQPGEAVPAGTGGVRLYPVGRATVVVSVGGRRGTGSGAGEVAVDLPGAAADDVAPRAPGEVCVRNAGTAALALAGEAFAPSRAARSDGAPQVGRARIDYLRPGEESWWALAPAIAERITGARAALAGEVAPYAWALLALAAVAIAVTRRRRLSAGGAIALLATLNALSWTMLVPPFHVPDEPAHVYYAQYLGETGKLPALRPGTAEYSGDIRAALAAARFDRVAGEPTGRPSWHLSVPDERERTGDGNASTASTNPPLYYLAQAAIYRSAHGLGVLDRLALMQLFSTLLAGATAWCVFAFLRELLPGSPLAAVVGGTLAALMPMLGFMCAGVTNDAALYLTAAAVFLALARILRHGLTRRRAAACGALLGAGVLVKTQMLAFAPAVVLAFVLAKAPRRAWALAAATAVLPLAVYGVLGQTIWRRPVLDRVDVLAAESPRAGGVLDQLSYVWQEYLPRLPLMSDLVPGVQPWSLWFKGLVGRFGWLDYGYPGWAYALALAIVVATTAVATVGARRGWRRHGRAIAVFVLAAGGLMGAVATVSYRAAPPFDQARYLLPLLPLLALLPALAVRAAGPRRGRLLGAVLVVGAVGFSVLAQLLTIARYYG
jgi:hypothetical protein